MKTRFISAAVLIVIAVASMLISPVTRILFFAVAAIICAYEYSRSVEKIGVSCAAWVMYTYVAIQAVISFFRLGVLTYAAWFVAGVYLALFSGVLHKHVLGKGAIFTVAGLAYPCLMFTMLMHVGVSDIWRETLIIGCVSSWACDSFALFGGSLFGKHKIAPEISPNKTVEGCVCGALSSILVGVGIYFLGKVLPFLELPLWASILICLIASTLGQVGDLAESMLKRMIGIKDFSNLIPGHGGMFDRADSLLFSIPTTYICLQLANLVV